MAQPAAYIDPADQRELARLLRSFGQQEVDRIMKRSASTAVRKTRTAIVRRIAKITTLKQKDVRVRTRLDITPQTTALVVTGPPTPISKFRWGRKGSRNAWGHRLIWAQIWRAKAREDLPYAFAIAGKSGGMAIVERAHRNDGSGKRHGRMPIKPVRGPAVPSILAYTPGELDDASTDGALVYGAEMQRQATLVLDRK